MITLLDRLKLLSGIAVVAICCFAATPSAQADPTMYINGTAVATGSNTLFFTGSTGSAPGWTIGYTFGMVTGTNGRPAMMLTFQVTSVAGAGPLNISFSASSFGPTQGLVNASFGGVVNPNGGSVTFGLLANGSPSIFANQMFGTGAYSGSASGLLNMPAFYSLTQSIDIMHFAAGTTSGTFMFETVPDAGSTLCLFGFGLAGLLALERRSRLFKRKPVRLPCA